MDSRSRRYEYKVCGTCGVRVLPEHDECQQCREDKASGSQDCEYCGYPEDSHFRGCPDRP